MRSGARSLGRRIWREAIVPVASSWYGVVCLTIAAGSAVCALVGRALG